MEEGGSFTLFGWDIYIIAFAVIGGTCVLAAIWYIFFTSLPMPRYCGGGRSSGSRICGYISRDSAQRPTNAT
jgi:hypothetical protein